MVPTHLTTSACHSLVDGEGELSRAARGDGAGYALLASGTFTLVQVHKRLVKMIRMVVQHKAFVVCVVSERTVAS